VIYSRCHIWRILRLRHLATARCEVWRVAWWRHRRSRLSSQPSVTGVLCAFYFTV